MVGTLEVVVVRVTKATGESGDQTCQKGKAGVMGKATIKREGLKRRILSGTRMHTS